MMAGACTSRFRYHLCQGLVLLAFAMVGARLVHLQWVDAREITGKVAPQRDRTEALAARRGDLLDRNGNVLAGTRSLIQVGVDPWIIDSSDRNSLAALAGLLDMPLAELEQSVSRREREDSSGTLRRLRWVPLKEVGEDLYAAVLRLNLRGVYGNRRYERHYPGRELAAHVVGYVNRESVPVMGLEQAMDFYLRGQAGWLETTVDGQRRELAAFRSREVPPAHGMDVQLTLDLIVQSIVERSLQDLVERSQPEGVSIIVSEPHSGEILALANYPTFDPNRFWQFPLEAQRNRAVTDQFEPGSTFKIVPIAAALEESLLEPESLLDCSIRVQAYRGVNIPLPSDTRELGEITLAQAVQKSSNRAAAQIGIMLGRERLYDYARAFGFGERVDWPLRGGVAGTLLDPQSWDGYAISRIPTGYTVAATPLQVHLAMATIANGGEYVRPRIVRAVTDRESGQSIPMGSDLRRRVVSEATAREMQKMLLAVVSPEGTARRAAIPGYEVAGKTGTARKLINGRYSDQHHLASFSGFFPARDAQVVITVIVDNPQVSGAAYGGAVAAPVFKEIGERLIPYLSIHKPEVWDPLIVVKD